MEAGQGMFAEPKIGNLAFRVNRVNLAAAFVMLPDRPKNVARNQPVIRPLLQSLSPELSLQTPDPLPRPGSLKSDVV